MKKILLLALPIMVMCAVSCEKEKEIVQGTIELIATYSGSCPVGRITYYYMCDIGQLDVIATLTQQIHEAAMNGNTEYADDIYNTLYDSVLSKGIYGFRQDDGDSWLSYDIEPGAYIVVAVHTVVYDYSNVDFHYISDYIERGKYKEVQIESGQTTSVAFSFEDYIVY